jgi:5-(carboxyamino)imidazole ribonucleotide mutase
MSQVTIIMGSKADLEWANRIVSTLNKFGIKSVSYIASAHKVPLQCYEIIKSNESITSVFITIAGRSNALSGFTDAQTYRPVIACPPVGDSYGGGDVFSSLRMPSGVAPMVILEPENAALASAKIIALANDDMLKKVSAYQQEQRDKLIKDNEDLHK